MKRPPPPHRNQRLMHRHVTTRQRMRRSEIVGIGCALLEAVAAAESGCLDETDRNTIAYAANLSLLLCEQGLGAEYAADLVRGQEAAAVLMAGGTLDAEGMSRLKRMAEIHIAQLESTSCNWALIDRAKNEMKRRTAAGNVISAEAAA